MDIWVVFTLGFLLNKYFLTAYYCLGNYCSKKWETAMNKIKPKFWSPKKPIYLGRLEYAIHIVYLVRKIKPVKKARKRDMLYL